MEKCVCLLINWQCSPVDGEVYAIYIGQQFSPLKGKYVHC